MRTLLLHEASRGIKTGHNEEVIPGVLPGSVGVKVLYMQRQNFLPRHYEERHQLSPGTRPFPPVAEGRAKFNMPSRSSRTPMDGAFGNKQPESGKQKSLYLQVSFQRALLACRSGHLEAQTSASSVRSRLCPGFECLWALGCCRKHIPARAGGFAPSRASSSALRSGRLLVISTSLPPISFQPVSAAGPAPLLEE
jgi:hypothetical protein